MKAVSRLLVPLFLAFASWATAQSPGVDPVTERLDWLTAFLGLSATQRESAAPLIRSNLGRQRDDRKSLDDRAAVMLAARERHEWVRSRLRPLLTPEQKARWAQIDALWDAFEGPLVYGFEYCLASDTQIETIGFALMERARRGGDKDAATLALPLGGEAALVEKNLSPEQRAKFRKVRGEYLTERMESLDRHKPPPFLSGSPKTETRR